jgi:amino acid transporter
MNDYTEIDKKQDLAVLHSMGYAQELERRMSGFSNFAISFSIICIMSGGINSLAQATSGAGGIAIGLGWPLGCLMSGFFALALAQISSAYPTAGGLYHWGSILGNRFGMEDTLVVRVGFVALITALMALINHMGIGLTAKLTDMSGYLILASAIGLTIVCLIAAPSFDVSRLFTLHNYTGDAGGGVWPAVPSGWAFALGLLLPVYTITGYDASAHTSEETVKAQISVPKGMVSSVLWAGIFGYIMLCAFVLMIPNMDDAAKQGWNVFFWAMDLQVNPAIKYVLYVAIFISQLLCGLATVTSASRMIFAFSRDGGLPGSKFLSKVSTAHRSPVAAIWTAAALSVAFVWFTSLPQITIGETSAYAIVVSCTVIFLFLSFSIPIALGIMTHGTPKWEKMGPWDLGSMRFKLISVLALISMVAIFVIGVQPPNDWALWITVGFLVLTGVVWLVFENRRFKGPPLGDMIAKRQAEIAEAEKAVGEH